MRAWPTSCCCSNRTVGTPATPVQSAWHWGCAGTSQATNSSPQSRNTPGRRRLPGAHGYHGPAVHAAARRPPRPSASNMATRPLLTTTLVAKTPAFGSHAFMGHRTLCGTMSVCLSVCSGLMVLFVRSHEAAAQSLSDLLRSTPGHHGHCGHLLSSTHHRVVNTLITAVDRLAPAPTRTRPRPKAGPNPGKKKRNSKLKVQISTGSAQQPHHHQQNALTTPGTRRCCCWSRCCR